MSTGTLVYIKDEKTNRPGIIVEIIGDVAIVYWPHGERTNMMYFHQLESV